jgi:PAS domain S-box-containing protein
VTWLGWTAAVVAGLGLVGLLEYYRLQRVVQRRTRELRASEQRYRDLFQQSPVALLEFDFSRVPGWFAELRTAGVKDLREHFDRQPADLARLFPLTPLTTANQAALQLLGASGQDELIAHLGGMLTPDAIQARAQLLCGMWEGKDPSMTGELTLRRVDGTLRHFRYDRHGAQPVAGRPFSPLSLTALVDITEQRLAEQALRDSEQRYRELFESAVGGVYRSDLAGRFVSVNPAFARILGYDSPAELMRRSGPGFAASLYVKPGRRDEFVAQLSQADYVTNFESEVRVRDGSTVWISENVHTIRDPQTGRPAYFDGFVSDITARLRLEGEFQRASKLEAVGILAGGIAHDFNNILTVVLGNVTLAEMDTEVTSAVARMLRDAKQATLRARDLTQQLLTFAKGGDPVRAVVALPELLRESAGFAMHGSKVRAVYELPEHLWPANVDKGQIGQVVQNLVINAVQAMPQGGSITLRAANVTLLERQVATLPAGDYIRLSVADNGVGIPSDHLAKIFDPYFTTKQTGSGLGLATVYSIIRKHQGHIEVESQLGTGTTFTFWLPAAPHGREDAPEPVPESVRLHGRVLFMDDEEPIRSMAGLFLSRLGLDYVLTKEGAETVRLYREALEAGQRFDLVIMDLTVPGGMGGREAMQQIRAIDPQVRAIVSSGYSRDPVLANYRAHGFSGILPKPYSLEQLQQTLRNVFGPGLTQPPF